MRYLVTALIIMAFSLPSVVLADGILTSKHNLSSSGPGKVRASGENQVCIFCHVTHAAESPRALWSRPLPTQPYRPY